MNKGLILLFGAGLIVVLSACSPAATATTAAPGTTRALPTTTTELASSPSPASSPQGTTVTPGDGQQVAAGQAVYNQDCTQCHGSKLEGSSVAPPINQSSLANYGDAQHLEEFISKEMPQNKPGSLTQQQYYDVTAFILNQLNLLPAGMQLTPQQASTVSLPTATPTPAGNGQPGTVAVKLAQVPVVGDFLTNNRGYTLYYYDKDTPGTSNCTDNCANIFPPFTVSAGETPIAEAEISGSLGILKRSDGSLQVSYTSQPTYNKVPLYRYYGDTEPGETIGNQYQDTWHIVSVNVATATLVPASTATPGPEGQAAIGVSIYEEDCTSCHGIQGQGVDAPPLRNNDFIQNQGDKTIFAVVANGRSNTEMPAWLQDNGGPLTQLQINDVVSYLHTLQNVSPLTPEPPPTSEPTPAPSPTGGPTPEPAQPSIAGGSGEAINLSGDIGQGQPAFGMYCAGCHGPQGVEGVPNPDSDDGSVPPLNPIDPTLVNPDPKTLAANVDLFIQNGSVPEGPNPLIMMPPFGSSKMLTQQQIADIIAYIISLNQN